MNDTDMTEANGETNQFGLSTGEWKFYQFVRASPKVNQVNSTRFRKVFLLKIVGCQIHRSSWGHGRARVLLGHECFTQEGNELQQESYICCTQLTPIVSSSLEHLGSYLFEWWKYA